MNEDIQTISLATLAFILIPVLITLIILWRWSLQTGNAIHALLRMLVQLLIIGYLLTYLFESDSAWVVLAVLLVMVLASSWIALGTVPQQRWQLYRHALLAIAGGGGLTFALVILAVLQLEPWYRPQFSIPLAGMVFANSMTSVSLAAERLQSELRRGDDYITARDTAMQAALIPIINSLFAVGLVSLPGMMTGQILSGVSPLIAVRYQIMVMGMIFGASGIATAMFLTLSRSAFLHQASTDSATNRAP
jgi:putative ABC transport system permease protein